MDELKEDIQTTTDLTSEYLQSEMNYLKAEVVDHVSDTLASVAIRFVFSALILLVAIIGCFALSYYVGAIMGNIAAGFGVVAGGLFTLLFITYVLRKYLLKIPIQGYFIRMIAHRIFPQ